MKLKALALAAPAALIALPLAAPAAAADQSSTDAYQANMSQLNDSGASGHFMMKMHGDKLTVTGEMSGLASKFQDMAYPHVEHIHGLGKGACPDMSADKNDDGIVDTVEGQSSYGEIQTTLSTKGDTSPDAGTDIKAAPGGSSYDYSRTISVNDSTKKALSNGNAVVVVHGLNPDKLSKKAQNEKSNLVKKLPIAATAPAACGVVQESQMSQMPSGGVDTGGGSTSGVEAPWLFGLGGAALLAAGGTIVLSSRRTGENR